MKRIQSEHAQLITEDKIVFNKDHLMIYLK